MRTSRVTASVAGFAALLLLVSGLTAAASDAGAPTVVPDQGLATLGAMVEAMAADGLVSPTLASEARALFSASPDIEQAKAMHWRVTQEVAARVAAGASVPQQVFGLAPASGDSPDPSISTGPLVGETPVSVDTGAAVGAAASSCQDNCRKAYDDCQGKCSQWGGWIECWKLPAPLQPWCIEIWRMCTNECETAYSRCLRSCPSALMPAESAERVALSSQVFAVSSPQESTSACQPAGSQGSAT